jgi:hypothetical protein
MNEWMNEWMKTQHLCLFSEPHKSSLIVLWYITNVLLHGRLFVTSEGGLGMIQYSGNTVCAKELLHLIFIVK